jgi:hypothetical protein
MTMIDKKQELNIYLREKVSAYNCSEIPADYGNAQETDTNNCAVRREIWKSRA